MSTILLLLVAWVVLSVPVALLIGGALRMSDRRARLADPVSGREHLVVH